MVRNMNKNGAGFTNFFNEDSDFNRSADGEVQEELSKIDIDVFAGTTKRRKED